MTDTKGLIIATVAITAAATFVKQMQGDKPPNFRAYLGASFMGIFLTGIGMVNDRLARNFAILIVFSVLLKNGNAVFTFASQSTKGKGAKNG